MWKKIEPAGTSAIRFMSSRSSSACTSSVWRSSTQPANRNGRVAVREIAEEVLSRRPDLTMIAGHLVFDFIPRIGWHKGTAARWMVSQLVPTLSARRAVVVYAGDDTSDEMAFAELRERAVTIHVGRKPTVAEYRVGSVRDVQKLLRRMAAALAS